MVALPLISVLLSGWPFGFASAPYDPHWAMRYPKRAAWMALAGPAGNLVLVSLAAAAIRMGAAAGLFEPPSAVSFDQVVAASADGIWSGAAFLLSVFFSLNLLLAIFNLIPVPPRWERRGALVPERRLDASVSIIHLGTAGVRLDRDSDCMADLSVAVSAALALRGEPRASRCELWLSELWVSGPESRSLTKAQFAVDR